MPLFKSRLIEIRNRKDVYRRGDELKGIMSFELCENIMVKGIHVCLSGQSLSKFPSQRSSSRDATAKETYTDQTLTVFGNRPESECEGPEIPMTVGVYTYQFSFKLPDERLPSSSEGEYGAIRYWIAAKVARPLFKCDEMWQCPITLIDEYDVNRPEFLIPITRTSQKQVSKTLGFGNAGNLSLTATINRTAYCPGESIAINAVANNSSEKNLGHLKAQLIQNITYSANDDNKICTVTMREVQGMNMSKGERREWKDQMLVIDPMPPSTYPHSCHIVNVRYTLKVLVKVPMGFDLECDIPIVIGTQPLRNSMDACDPPPVKYTKCITGYKKCDKCSDKFPSCEYVPMCPYVRMNEDSAGSLPQKAALSPPSAVNEKSSSVEANDICAQPQVPVADLPPPYSQIAGCQDQQDVSQIQETGSVYGTLLLRFPDRYLQEFRDSMEKETSTSLLGCGGRVIALAPQTLMKPSTWPKRTAIAMLNFTNEESAGEWFRNTPGIKSTEWMQSCDAVVVTSEETFKEGNDVYSIVSKEYRDGVSQTDKQIYNKMFEATVVPLRTRKNGVGSVKQHKLLQGLWLTDKWTLTIIQWENLLQYHVYKNELQQDAYQDIRDEMNKNFASVDEVVIQSEDLTP